MNLVEFEGVTYCMDCLPKAHNQEELHFARDFECSRCGALAWEAHPEEDEIQTPEEFLALEAIEEEEAERDAI
jgi:hypothetical protein